MNQELKESVSVLLECIDIQKQKGQDYQSEASRIHQADHYPHGIDTIVDMAWQKIIRIYSVLAVMKDGKKQNFESVEDSCKDAINYLSFAVEYLRFEMDGQNKDCDIFNRPLEK